MLTLARTVPGSRRSPCRKNKPQAACSCSEYVPIHRQLLLFLEIPRLSGFWPTRAARRTSKKPVPSLEAVSWSLARIFSLLRRASCELLSSGNVGGFRVPQVPDTRTSSPELHPDRSVDC